VPVSGRLGATSGADVRTAIALAKATDWEVTPIYEIEIVSRTEIRVYRTPRRWTDEEYDRVYWKHGRWHCDDRILVVRGT
jgi:hypothetical protein